MAVHLRNPHSILATFERRPEAVVNVTLPSAQPSDAWREVERLARAHRVPVTRGERTGRRAPREVAGGRGGIAEATIKERPEVPLEVLFGIDSQSQAEAASRPAGSAGPRIWVALDQLQDPHNVGAIFRTAAFFGVAGVLLTRDRSAPLNGAAYDVASGALEVVPYSQPSNLVQAIELAKAAGLWVLGTSEHAERDVREVDRDRSWLLIVGNEEHGLRRLTLDKCDEACRLTPRGAIGSLNVSVAAGVLMALLTQPGVGPSAVPSSR